MPFSLTPGRPTADEYDSYFEQYLSLVTEDDVIGGLGTQLAELRQLLEGLTDEVGNTVHAPYSWTVKQVVAHVLDNERVFGYRAARLAAGDETPLPGYEQNDYVVAFNYKDTQLADLVDEFGHQRSANIKFFSRLENDAWMRRGTVDNRTISVRAILYLQLGHARHHLSILQTRLASS